MALEFSAGEKVLYTKDYGKGRKRSHGNVTVTNKRLISTVESKCGEERTEFKIDKVEGVSVKLNLASFAQAVLCLIYIVAYEVAMRSINGATFSVPGGFAGLMVPVFFNLIWIFWIMAIIFFILGLFKLGSCFKIGIYSENSEKCLVAVQSGVFALKPLKIKVNRALAMEIANEVSAAISEAKFHS